MSGRVAAALVLVAAVGVLPPAALTAPVRIVAVARRGPDRDASRDRTLPGKARVRARRNMTCR